MPVCICSRVGSRDEIPATLRPCRMCWGLRAFPFSELLNNCNFKYSRTHDSVNHGSCGKPVVRSCASSSITAYQKVNICFSSKHGYSKGILKTESLLIKRICFHLKNKNSFTYPKHKLVHLLLLVIPIKLSCFLFFFLLQGDRTRSTQMYTTPKICYLFN